MRGGALKFGNLENVRMFGATYRRSRQLTLTTINLNTISRILLGFQKSELPLFQFLFHGRSKLEKLQTAPRRPQQLTLERAEGVIVDPLNTTEVE